MAHTYTSLLFHCVFSTKDRRPLIDAELQERLWPYLGGIAAENKMRASVVGGVEDHVHMVVSLPSKMDVAKAMQLIKGGSSKWIHDTFPNQRAFAWQDGYGAFSIGVSQLAATRKYIENQQEHHRKQSFQEEFVAFLKKHAIDYDPRYIWK
jgi:REP element-mobilizing transposase RayT